MTHAIGNIPPNIPELRGTILFDAPTAVALKEYPVGHATSEELSSDATLMVGRRLVAAAGAAGLEATVLVEYSSCENI